MESTPRQRHCDVCGKDELGALFWTSDRRLGTTNEPYLILTCRSCGIGQAYPRPTRDELAQLYPETYYPTKEPARSYYKKYIERFQKDKVSKVKKFANGGKVLDVGCGVGYFVKQAIDAGFDAQGIEFSEVAVAGGKDRLGLDLLLGDFVTFPFDENSFDVVTLWHVFEHLYNPRRVIQRCRHILKPKGLLVIATPNLSSLQAKLFRERWYHLDAPRHLFVYSPRSLTKLVEQNGFRARKVDHYSIEHNGAGILGSLIRISPPSEAFLHKVFRKTAGITIANALAWLESTIYQGGTFTLFAVKV